MLLKREWNLLKKWPTHTLIIYYISGLGTGYNFYGFIFWFLKLMGLKTGFERIRLSPTNIENMDISSTQHFFCIDILSPIFKLFLISNKFILWYRLKIMDCLNI